MLLLHPFTIALHSATPTSKGLIAAAPKAALLPHGAHVLLTLVGEWLGPCACSTLSVCPTSRASTLAKRRPAWGRSATRAMVGLLTISLLLAISTLASNTRRSALATGLAACTVTTGLRLATVSTRPVAGLTAEARLGPKPTWTTLSAALWLRAVRHLVARVVEAAQWVTVTYTARKRGNHQSDKPKGDVWVPGVVRTRAAFIGQTHINMNKGSRQGTNPYQVA